MFGSIFLRFGLGIFDRPACITVFLGQLCGFVFPALGNLARFDVSLFAIPVALLGRGNQSGIDNLPAHRQIARLGEMFVEPGEQVLHRPGLGQVFAEQPDGFGIRHFVIKSKP